MNATRALPLARPHRRLLVAAAVLSTAIGCSSDGESTTPVVPTETSTLDALDATPKSVPEGIPVPELSEPVTGGTYGVPFLSIATRLEEEFGYLEAEYFVSGDARSFARSGEWSQDGVWAAEAADTAPFQTRMIVRQPADPADFNGTLYVEWLNVSAGMDADPQWGLGHEELLRQGYAYVGVSAQESGVEGGGFEIPIEGFDTRPLIDWDPERYGSLNHPGDTFSFDIFSQAAAAALNTEEGAPLADLTIERILGGGESQSAMRMVTYVNAVHPITELFDGFLVHSRGASAPPLQEADEDLDALGAPHIRTDLTVPVMQYQTESDLFGVLGFAEARQSDTDLIRTWEVAGAAHADQFVLDAGVEAGQKWAEDTSIDFEDQCGVINRGPQRMVLRRAIRDLDTWVRDGTPPVSAPLIESSDTAILRDEDGIALGGIRTPDVDAPIAVFSGETAPGASLICVLFGSTAPFTPEQITSRYATQDEYVAAVTASAADSVANGWLLPEEEAQFIEAAESADLGL